MTMQDLNKVDFKMGIVTLSKEILFLFRNRLYHHFQGPFGPVGQKGEVSWSLMPSAVWNWFAPSYY